jgi:ferric-dicitrate binding protein FerR (iron transport regulator)
MNQENFWVLLSKKLSGEASGTELTELENLILEHPEWQYAIQNLGDLWKHQPAKDDIHAQDAYMLHLHRMTELNIPFGDSPGEIPAAGERKIKKWYWAAAAVFILSISVLGFNSIFKKKTGKSQVLSQVNEISTRKGSKSKVQLPDGSVVWLNAGSKLTYDKDFGKELREVTLTGEGFFDVQKMKDKPFIVHTSSINIKVLGTVFNVKAYPEDKKTETSLIHGSIEVTMKNRPNDKIILSPSEKLIVDNNKVSDKITTGRQELKESDPVIDMLVSINKLKYSPEDSAVAETQWIDNKLVFEDESFEDLAMKMERWYDVEIEIKNEKLLGKRMTGNFEKETIVQAMEALKLMIPFI